MEGMKYKCGCRVIENGLCVVCGKDPASTGNSELLCTDCGADLTLPLAKPMDCGDGQPRCAGCVVDKLIGARTKPFPYKKPVLISTPGA